MKLGTLVSVACMIFAGVAKADITVGTSMIAPSGGGMIGYGCMVKQTTGAADHMAWPDGKGYACTLETPVTGPALVGLDLGCTTNAPAGHYCVTGSDVPRNEGVYSFDTGAYGNNGGLSMQDYLFLSLTCPATPSNCHY